MLFKRIDHVELVPADLERTIAFYTTVLGFSVKSRHLVGAAPLREVAYLTLGDTMLELLGIAGPLPPRADAFPVGYHMLALEVSDMKAALDYLEKQGIRASWGPVALGTSIRAEIQDPDGLPIELRQWLADAPA